VSDKLGDLREWILAPVDGMRTRVQSGRRPCQYVFMRTRSVHASVPVLAAFVLLVAGCDRPGVSSGAVTLNTSVGTVTAECIDQSFVKVDGASPTGGYSSKIVVEGPSSEASVLFERAGSTDVRVAIRCVDGQLRVEELTDTDIEIPPEN
jgi:hypothetical protein